MNDLPYPPIEYLFIEEEQPAPAAWEAVIAFAAEWNGKHQSKFVKGEFGEWGVVLKGGIYDEEYPVLAEAIEKLKNDGQVIAFLGAVDTRRPEDFEKSPYVAIVGDAYPEGFVVNAKNAFGKKEKCPQCKRFEQQSGPMLETLIIDESFLDIQVDPSPDFSPPGLDLINLENGALLVSKKMIALFESCKVKGYELLPVISHQTGKPSERVFLIRANKAILQPCEVHTPATPEGICPVCGRILGGLLGYYYVREEWLGPDQVFSRNRQRYSAIYVSNELYQAMKSLGTKGMLPAFGIYKCRHAPEAKKG